MMLRYKRVVLALGAASGIVAAVLSGVAPALGQDNPDGVDAYQAGVKLGRGLLDARQCTGSGVYHDGCVDGVEESQFDRQADQAMDSIDGAAKPADHAPVLSPPPGLFHQSFSRPDDGTPPNN